MPYTLNKEGTTGVGRETNFKNNLEIPNTGTNKKTIKKKYIRKKPIKSEQTQYDGHLRRVNKA